MFKKKFKMLSVWLAMVLLLLTLFGCSSNMGLTKDKNTPKNEATVGDGVYNNGYLTETENKPGGSQAGQNNPQLDAVRKIIVSASMKIETLKYDECIVSFEKLVAEYLGFIQESSVQNSTGINDSSSLRNASYTVRIPSNKLAAFRTAAGNVGTVTLNTVSGNDITDQYYDTQTRLSSLKVQETRLLELLSKAASLKDMLDIEDRLEKVRYEIESLTGTLAKMNSLVDMSTVSVSISEVKTLSEPEPESFFAQLGQIFKDSIDALLMTLRGISYVIVAVLPFALVFGAIAGLIVLIVTLISRKRKIKKATKKDA